MKTRSTTSDKTQTSEQHRQLANNNFGGDTHAPASPAYTNGANPDKLAELAGELRLCHESCQKREAAFQAAMKMSVGEGIKCGMILLEIKGIVGHGHFMKWVKANTQISQKTVQRYIALAKNKESVTILNAAGLNDCYAALGLIKKSVGEADNTSAGQTSVDGSSDCDDEDSEVETDPNEALFAKAKKLSSRLAQLAVQTNDQDRLAAAVKPFIAWYENYLTMKAAAKQKAEQDAEFEKGTSIAA